jgi:hypothetical protein
VGVRGPELTLSVTSSVVAAEKRGRAMRERSCNVSAVVGRTESLNRHDSCRGIFCRRIFNRSARSVERYRTLLAGAVCALALALLAGVMHAQALPTFATPQQLVNAMVVQERESAAKHELYDYISVEKSDRTGGHTWTERVVETSLGKVRMLLAIDGKPLAARLLAARAAAPCTAPYGCAARAASSRAASAASRADAEVHQVAVAHHHRALLLPHLSQPHARTPQVVGVDEERRWTDECQRAAPDQRTTF